MTCQDCESAKTKPHHPIYKSGCPGCEARMLEGEKHKADCYDAEMVAMSIRRMDRQSQVHQYETLERNKGKEYADRIRKINANLRESLIKSGMTYDQIRSRKA